MFLICFGQGREKQLHSLQQQKSLKTDVIIFMYVYWTWKTACEAACQWLTGRAWTGDHNAHPNTYDGLVCF